METTFKVVLDKRRAKRNNTFPLKFRVYQGGDYKSYSLGIDLRDADWNEQTEQVKSSHPSHKLHNVKIADAKAKLQKTIFIRETEGKHITPETLIAELTGEAISIRQVEKPDILVYGRKHIEKLEATGHIGNGLVYKCAINKLEEFVGTGKLTFEQVNYFYVEHFNNTLLAEGIKVNSISNYLRTIRALFNKAITEGIIKPDCYPFSRFKIRSERTISRTLTLSEITSIVKLDLPVNSPIWHHRNLFLLSFCLIGINFADLLTLKKENFVDGRIVFRRRKTHKVYSILAHPQAQEIFNLYKTDVSGTKKCFVLPFVEDLKNPITLKKHILQAIKNTNDYLRKMAQLCFIEKPISTYYARYAWANVAKGLGYSKDLIAEALGHEYGNKVTGIYLDSYDLKLIDEMNRKVLEICRIHPD